MILKKSKEFDVDTLHVENFGSANRNIETIECLGGRIQYIVDQKVYADYEKVCAKVPIPFKGKILTILVTDIKEENLSDIKIFTNQLLHSLTTNLKPKGEIEATSKVYENLRGGSPIKRVNENF